MDIHPSSRLAKHRPASSSVDDEAESDSDISLDQASTAASSSENRLYLRNPMIWALLCSTALQDIKEDLVLFFKRKLADDRSLALNCLSLVWLPFGAVTTSLADIYNIFAKWNQYVREYENVTLQKPKRTEADTSQAQSGVAKPEMQGQGPLQDHLVPTQPGGTTQHEQATSTNQGMPVPLQRKPSRRSSINSSRGKRRRRKRAYLPPAFQALGNWLSAYTHMGVKAYKSQHSSRQPNVARLAGSLTSHEAAGRTTHQSNALFSWLFKACLAYQLYDWLRAHWSTTVHLALLATTTSFVLSLLPFLYFALHQYWHWYQNSKTHLGIAPEREAAASVDRSKVSGQDGARQESRHPWPMPAKKVHGSWTHARTVGRSADAWLKHSLVGNLDALVALALIVMLLLGSLALTGFLTVRIGQEGSDTVAVVKAFIPDKWRAGSAMSAPVCAATSLNFTAVCEEDADFQATPEPISQGVVQQWLGKYQDTAVQYAQQGYDQIQDYVRSNFNDYVEANNLTQVVARDVGTLWATLQPPSDCTPAQRESLLLEVATASAAAHSTWKADQDSLLQVRQAQQSLSAAISQWEGAAGGVLEAAPRALLEASHDGSHPMHQLESQVVQLQADLKQLTATAKTAARAADAAKEELVLAQRRLGHCSGVGATPHTPQLIPASARNMGGRLQQAYTLLWKLHLSEGWSMLKGVGQESYSVVKQGMQGNSSSSSSGELTALQRLAAAGSEPLLALGRALGAHLVHSLGSTTSVALTGGLTLIRLGVGVVKLGVQFTLFVAMLFLLLSAQQDPIQQAVRILPMSETAREHTATSFSDALRGVFQSALKLAVFHAVFTWLTFRAFSIQLVYVSTVASAVCSILPLVQVWMVAIPAALQLLVQDRMLAAALLMLLHLAAFFQADDVIMREIPGSHPYLTGLGILAGMYSFANPLQGALFGPMLLSMLSVVYNLHAKLFRDEAPTSERHHIVTHHGHLS
ncbi:hypothetical protein ABBQ38_003282 [Trebouxia sp. C0009 RCD-2024]